METPLVVFVSSVIAGLQAERQAVRTALQAIPLTRPWVFEFSPASSLPLAESYLSQVRTCDIFLLLLGDRVTDPVKAEVETAQAAGKPLLVFVGQGAPRQVVEYAQSLGVKYATFGSPEQLAAQAAEATADELITGYRRLQVPRADLGALGAFLDRAAAGQLHIDVGGDLIVAQEGPVVSRQSAYAAGQGQAVAVSAPVSGQVIVARGNVYLGPATRDPAEALRIYREVLVHGSRFLPMRGVDVGVSDPAANQQPLSLAHVYIHLDTKTPVKLKAEDKRRKRGDDDQSFLREEQESRPLSALEAASEQRQMVLLGDPGSGKSTFAAHLVHCLAAHGLQPETGWLEQVPGWPQPDATPILVVLRDFARWLAAGDHAKGQAEPHHVWDFVRQRLEAQNLGFAAEPLHAALDDGQVLVLFDGLDEIAGRAPARFVRDAVAAFAGRYKRSRHLVTCRTLSYQHPDWRLDNFPDYELAPFSETKIDAFVSAWYGELAEQGVAPAQEVDGLSAALSAALRRPDLWRLAPNPLLLTVMALVHTHRGRLPDARALLYEETVDILLWRWEQIKSASAPDEAPALRQLLLQAGRSEVDLKRVLWRLAFEAHAVGGATDDDEAVADIGELRLLRELAGLCGDDLGWAQQVVDAMKLRAGLLVERQPEVFSFPHRTFQEYLAGAYLASQADFKREGARLAGQGAQWREVIRLAVGRLVYLAGDLDKPLALMAELCPSRRQDTDAAWGKAWLAGDVALEMGVGRMADSELGRDLLARVRERLAELVTLGRLSPVERAAAGQTLGRLGDPRPGVGLRPDGVPDIVWCEVEAGEFVMGNTKQTDREAYDDEMPQHPVTLPAFAVSQYPITNAQFDAFVQDGGYSERWRSCWTKDGWRWKGDRTGPDKAGGAFDLPNHPVVMITWYEAVAYCRWLSQKLGQPMSLPSEAQWERAARWTDGRRYPWDEQITPDHANYSETGIGTTTAVGIFPLGASQCGALDMSGNVWEWCSTQWRENYKTQANEDPEGQAGRVVRGGSFRGASGWLVRCAVRYWYDPGYRNVNLGLRVVALSPAIMTLDSGDSGL
jgi:formylglycine-generating enzyme required for sulfatase activity